MASPRFTPGDRVIAVRTHKALARGVRGTVVKASNRWASIDVAVDDGTIIDDIPPNRLTHIRSRSD